MTEQWPFLCLLLAGSVYFPLLYSFIKLILKKYHGGRLSTGDICLIGEKCTCSVQAIMSFVTGGIIVSQVTDIMYDTHWLSNSYAWFALPYFIHDIWAMYNTFIWNEGEELRQAPLRLQLNAFVRRSFLLLAHHTLLPAIIFPAIIFYRKNLGDFFVGAFYMIEVTIPFISARAIMVQLKLKDTPYYILMGLLMLVSFFCSRVLIFPYLYWQYALYAGIQLGEVPSTIPIKCNLSCLLLLLPQLYWFWLMLRGTVRVFYKIFIRWRSKSHEI